METSSRAAQQLSGHCLQGPSSVPFELRIRLPAACSAAVTPAPVCCLANPAGMYSPIQRLVDQQQAMFASFSCGRNATAPFVLDKDSAYSTRPGHDLALPTRVPDDTPFNCEDDDDMSLSARTSEHIGESAGAAGDEYRFRYDRVVSPEEGYSPIAAVHLAHRSSGILDRQHVWSTHIDDDGAVCSQPIPGPLRLAVALPCGSSAQVQVVDGMTVSNLKDKLWNMTGFAPLRQRLVLPNGGELSDTMDFIDCGLQPCDRLALRIS